MAAGWVGPGWAARGCFLALLALLALLAGGIGVRAGEVRLLFAPSPERVTAGGTVSIWLHWLNGTGEEATGLAPLTIQGTLTQGAQGYPVTLRLASPYDTAALPVPAGGFGKREYFLLLPEGVAGRVLLELAFAEANLVAFDIAPAPGPGLGQTPATADGTPAPGGAVEAEGEAIPVRADDAVAFFREHFFPHEPIYFIAGTETPNAKFQISFKYQLFTAESRLFRGTAWITNLFVGYTQMSLWDWNTPSAPFYDSSYKPEFLYVTSVVPRASEEDWFGMDLHGGVQHESNGRGGPASRSLNYAYLRPFFTFGRPGAFNVTLAPKVFVYLGDLSDNPDIEDYRGYVELRGILGWERHVQLSALGRVGDSFDRGSVQVDLTYPMWRLPVLKSSVFLHAQYFEGYGESLLFYNQRTWAVRAGFALSR